ncbi:MAG: hypothetical protein ACK4NA_12175 [Alphaproteobacteria bacterium]
MKAPVFTLAFKKRDKIQFSYSLQGAETRRHRFIKHLKSVRKNLMTPMTCHAPPVGMEIEKRPAFALSRAACRTGVREQARPRAPGCAGRARSGPN